MRFAYLGSTTMKLSQAAFTVDQMITGMILGALAWALHLGGFSPVAFQIGR